MTALLLLSLTLAEPLHPDAIRRFAPSASVVPALDGHAFVDLRPTRNADAVWVFDQTAGKLLTVAYGEPIVTVRVTFPKGRIPRRVVITEDDRHALTECDPDVEVWNLADGKRRCVVSGIVLTGHAEAWSAADDRLVLRSATEFDSQVGAIDCRDGSWRAFESASDVIGLTDQGRGAIVLHRERFSIVDIRTGKEMRGMPAVKRVSQYVPSPTGRECLAVGIEAIQRIDLGTLGVRPWLTVEAQSVSIAEDGETVALVPRRQSNDDLVSLYSLRTDTLLRRAPVAAFRGRRGAMLFDGETDLRLSGDGKWMVSRRTQNRFRIDLPPGERPFAEGSFARPSSYERGFPFMEFRTEDELLCIEEKQLESRSISTGRVRWTMAIPKDTSVSDAVLSPARDRIALPGMDKDTNVDTLRMIALTERGATVREFKSDRVVFTGKQCLFNRDGSRLLTHGTHEERQCIAIWNTATGVCTHRVDCLPNFEHHFDGTGHAVWATPQGKSRYEGLVLNDRTGEWDTAVSPAQRGRWNHDLAEPTPEPADSAATVIDTLPQGSAAYPLFRFDLEFGSWLGRYVQSGAVEVLGLRGRDGLNLYDLHDPEPFATLAGKPKNLSLSPAGTALAVSDDDGSVTVWDMRKLRARKPVVPVPLSPEEWELAWNDLRSHFREPALAALRKLELDPVQTLREVPRRLPPAGKLNPQAITATFDKLGDGKTRRAAYEELRAIDVRLRPFAELHRTRIADDSEAGRLTRCLVETVATPDHHANRQAYRTIELLRRMQALELLRKYAAGDPEAILTTEAKYALTR